jgi:hypothetical protein
MVHEREIWTNHQTDKVWWKPLHQSMSKLNNNDLVRIQNFTHNYLPTNKRKNIHNNNQSEKCEVRNNNIETENHTLRCETAKRESIREQCICDLDTFMSHQHTPVEVKDCIPERVSNG